MVFPVWSSHLYEPSVVRYGQKGVGLGAENIAAEAIFLA